MSDGASGAKVPEERPGRGCPKMVAAERDPHGDGRLAPDLRPEGDGGDCWAVSIAFMSSTRKLLFMKPADVWNAEGGSGDQRLMPQCSLTLPSLRTPGIEERPQPLLSSIQQMEGHGHAAPACNRGSGCRASEQAPQLLADLRPVQAESGLYVPKHPFKFTCQLCCSGPGAAIRSGAAAGPAARGPLCGRLRAAAADAGCGGPGASRPASPGDPRRFRHPGAPDKPSGCCTARTSAMWSANETWKCQQWQPSSKLRKGHAVNLLPR